MIHLIFCLRHAAHALTFLEIPGSLLVSTAAPLAVLCVRFGGGCFAIDGRSSLGRNFFGEVDRAGD